MRLSRIWSLALATSFVVAAACSGNPQPTPSTAPPTEPAATIPSVPASASSAPPVASASVAVPDVWKDGLSIEEQVAYMKAKIAPRMGKVLQAHDPKRYADFSCKTCHGPDSVEPKKFLPKLTMKGGKLTAFADKPEVAKFMSEVIVPEMASAMGQKPYDPATKQGFGCMGCHGVDMK